MKLKLRTWVKVVLFILIVFSIVTLFTRKTTIITEGKNYTCYGSLIQVCNGFDYDVE